MMLLRGILLSLLLVPLAGLFADERRPEVCRTSDVWRVQAGVVRQWGRGVRFSGPAAAVNPGVLAGGLPCGPVTPRAGDPLPTYDLTSFVPRTFDDGYVNPDLWTGDSGLQVTDPERYATTWNWQAGSGQYNYDAGDHPTLTYHLHNNPSIDAADTVAGSRGDDDLPAWGFEVKALRALHTWTNDTPVSGESVSNVAGRLDLVLGVAWFPQARQQRRQSASREVEAVTETYTYRDFFGTAAGGSWGSLDPSLPYTGNYWGPGPLIPALPEGWDPTVVQVGTVRDRVTLEASCWHMRGELGAMLTRPLSDRWSVSFAPQLVAELVVIQAWRDEALTWTDATSGQTTVLARERASRSRVALVPGLLLTAGMDYQLSEHWNLGGSVGWEKLAGAPTLRIGRDRVRFELDGWEGSLYLGRSF
jgi:hypothetical protein